MVLRCLGKAVTQVRSLLAAPTGVIMVSKNDITGDSIQTKGTSENYRNNYDLIFRKKQKEDNTGIDKNKLEDSLPDNTNKNDK